MLLLEGGCNTCDGILCHTCGRREMFWCGADLAVVSDKNNGF